MSVLTRDDRSNDQGLSPDGGGGYPRVSPSPRCLSGLHGILASAELRTAGPAPVAIGPGPRPRLKLWEIDRSWHCAILGICLDPTELRAVAAKSDSLKSKARGTSDFDLHIEALRFACRDRDLGKALTKALDRKHARIIAQLAKTRDQETLRARWEELLAQGEAAGAYWALMSHPEISDETRLEISGDAHMRLYQGFGVGRADLRRAQALERELAAVEERTARRLAQSRDTLARKDAEIDDLRRRLVRQPADAGAARSGDAEHWRTQATELRRRLDAEEVRARADDETARQTQAELRDLRARVERLAARNEELAAENATLSRDAEPWGDDTSALEGADLDGRTILFVGGRHQHIPHYRRLVEQRNGTFIHHDGGVDDSIARLRGLFGRADTVLFPVDCVSHMAQDELKRLCRRWDKPFVPVRRSGLGAFLVALEAAASVATD